MDELKEMSSAIESSCAGMQQWVEKTLHSNEHAQYQLSDVLATMQEKGVTLRSNPYTAVVSACSPASANADGTSLGVSDATTTPLGPACGRLPPRHSTLCGWSLCVVPDRAEAPAETVLAWVLRLMRMHRPGAVHTELMWRDTLRALNIPADVPAERWQVDIARALASAGVLVDIAMVATPGSPEEG
jgi:hypothetical protein